MSAEIVSIVEVLVGNVISQDQSEILITEVTNETVLELCKQGPAGPTGPKGDQGETGPQGPSAVILSQYTFNEPAMEWQVNHNKNTTVFIPTLFDVDGAQFSSNLRVVDQNTFVVRHTKAISGYVNVLFNNPEVTIAG